MSKKKKTEKKLKKKSGKKSKTVSESVISELTKNFAVQVMTKDVADLTPYYIPFKHKGLQFITGGVPGGRMTEISGDSQCGKSYLLYELIRSCQEMGGNALLMDPENAYEIKYGQRVGIDGEFIYTNEINQMEKCFALGRKYIKTVRKKHRKNMRSPVLVGLDSYPAMNTIQAQKEITKLEKSSNESLKGYLAAKKNALFSELISDFIPFVGNYDVSFVLINQIRQKMNVMFGDPTTTNAENIIKFYATLRLQGRLGSKVKTEIRLSAKDKKKKKSKQIGVNSVWKTIKNRHIDPFKEVTTKIIYQKGIDPLSGLADLMVMEEVFKPVTLKKSGNAGFKWNGVSFTESRLPKVLKKHPEIIVRV